MKGCLLFLIILFFNITIAQTPEDKNELPVNKIQKPELIQPTDTVPKAITLTDSLPNEWKLGYKVGRSEGSKKNLIGWFASGFVGGALGCCIGGGIVWLVANAKEDDPYFIPRRDTIYNAGYLKGYEEGARDKKTSAAILGSITGTACFLAVVFIIIIETFPDIPFHGWK